MMNTGSTGTEYTSDIRVDDTRAVERAAFNFQGREYASGGFSVDLERGRMVAYVTVIEGQSWLTTWGGERLTRLHMTGRSKSWMGYAGIGTVLYAYRTVDPIAGWYWYGRGLGAEMSLKLRKGRKAKVTGAGA